VAKITHPKVLNDLRPIALTSLAMKCFEKRMKMVLLIKTENLLDPQQFLIGPGEGLRIPQPMLGKFIFYMVSQRGRSHNLGGCWATWLFFLLSWFSNIFGAKIGYLK
jgi:hypothetical protein